MMPGRGANDALNSDARSRDWLLLYISFQIGRASATRVANNLSRIGRLTGSAWGANCKINLAIPWPQKDTKGSQNG